MQARTKAAAAGRRAVASAALAALAAGFGAAPAVAQYTVPGSVTTELTIPPRQQFEESLRTAPWRAGAVRLAPWIGLRDASVVTNRGTDVTTEDDFTLTAGLGLRGYLPTGKLTWVAHALPEYVWWQEDENKRSFNGRFGLGLFGHFNRLRLQLSQRRVEQQAFFSDEVRELTTTRTDESDLILELDAARRLTIYGAARRLVYENEERENPILTSLDRDEETLEIGLRYRTPKGLTLGLGFTDSSSDFAEGARDLSNSGSGLRILLGLEGSRVDARLGLERRDLSANEGSEFGDFDDTVGDLELAWSLTPRALLLTYARRDQRFSVDVANSYSLSERQGVRLELGFGQSSLGLIGEVGEDDFTAVETGSVGRIDDVRSYGAELRTDFKKLGLAIRFLSTDYDSNSDELDREVATVGFSLELGKLIEKLGLGRPPGDW